MAGKPKNNALRKRQVIANATKTMFLWVAIAAIAAAFSVVTVQFLYQKWTYNNKVIGAKSKAVGTLEDNIENAKRLRQEVNALVSNEALASVKTSPDDQNTKSVLDALPSTSDTPALATSLQQAIASRSGVTIESITLPTTSTGQLGQTSSTGSAGVQPGEEVGPQQQRFNITVSGSYDKIRSFMLDLERTIRPMQIERLTLTGTDSNMRAAFDVVTYYQSAKTVNIKQEVVQ